MFLLFITILELEVSVIFIHTIIEEMFRLIKMDEWDCYENASR